MPDTPTYPSTTRITLPAWIIFKSYKARLTIETLAPVDTVTPLPEDVI